ncbi:MAG: hypothetical protein H7061_14305, partial [Bdellovibrionaceae bacterium]|nr:hypothetical protein [Bdellovibrio sp.]
NETTHLDIPGNELQFNETLQVNSTLGNEDEITLLIAASLVADTMIPTDIKKIETNQPMSLNSLPGKPAYILSVIQKQSEFMKSIPGSDRMSAALLPYTSGLKPTMLPLVTDPTISLGATSTVHFPPSPQLPGVAPLAHSILISDLVEIENGKNKILVPQPRWEIMGIGWASDVQLPAWPLAGTTNRMRVGITFIGSSVSANNKLIPALDDSLIEAATHVSHASTDF